MTSRQTQFDGSLQWPARASAARDGSNIVPFPHPHPASAAPDCVLRPDDRPAPFVPPREPRGSLAACFVGALALHAGLYALERPPPPAASIGEITVSVDILLGSQVTAGLGSTPNPATVASPAPAETEQTAQQDSAQPPPDPPASQQTAMREPAPQSQSEAEPLAREPVVVEPPKSSIAPPPPAVERKRAMREPRAKPQRESSQRATEGTRATPSSVASAPSSGVGRGRSDADSNYIGLVHAHLARHQQYPAEARERGEQGSTRVTFKIDGSGRVTNVRLSQASGIASLDREAQARVWRASPFPAPPNGRAMELSVPMGFRLQQQ